MKWAVWREYTKREVKMVGPGCAVEADNFLSGAELRE